MSPATILTTTIAAVRPSRGGHVVKYRGTRARTAAFAASAIVMCGAGFAAAETYGDPQSGRTDLRPFTAEEADAVADRITQDSTRDVGVPDILSELGGDSFAGLRIEDGRRIVSYWVGEIPTDVERYAASEPEGVTIELAPAEYSRAQLSEAADRILDSRYAESAAISHVSLESDGSGLEIAVEGSIPSDELKEDIAAVAELPGGAIFYEPNSGPIVRTPAIAALPEPGS